MKSLLAASLLLLINLGCGGYGSGMGSTPMAVTVISPNSGTYSTPLMVTISASVPNAVIYVTTDGSMADSLVSDLSGPVLIDASRSGEGAGHRRSGWVFDEPCRCRQLYPAVGLLTL